MEKQNTVYPRFSVYKHVLITKKDIRITSLFIVLKIDKMGTIMLFTDWHKYVKTNSRKAAHRITENSNKIDKFIYSHNFNYANNEIL